MEQPLKEVEVFDSEWRDNGKTLWLNGIEGDVYYREADEFGEAGWIAGVQATSSRCEWPELYSYDVFATEEEALAAATKSIRKADASYPHISYV